MQDDVPDVATTRARSMAARLPRDSRRLMVHGLRRGMVLTRDPNRAGSSYWHLAKPVVEDGRVVALRDDEQTKAYNTAYGRKYGWEVHGRGRLLLETIPSDVPILWLSSMGVERTVRHDGPIEVDLSHLRLDQPTETDEQTPGRPASSVEHWPSRKDVNGIEREICLLVEIERRLATTGRCDGSARSPDEVTSQALAIYSRMSAAVEDCFRHTESSIHHDVDDSRSPALAGTMP